MTNEEHKKALEILKSNLTDNLAIYHERVTLLVQLSSFEIQDTNVEFTAKIIKPLDKNLAEENHLYQVMLKMPQISFGSQYLFAMDHSIPLLNGKKIGRPYCPFSLWLDSDLSKFVLDNNDEITKQIPEYILANEDWTHLKGNLK